MKTIFTWEVGLLFFSLKGNPPLSLSRLPRLLPPVVAVLFRLLEAVLVILLCNIVIIIIILINIINININQQLEHFHYGEMRLKHSFNSVCLFCSNPNVMLSWLSLEYWGEIEVLLPLFSLAHSGSNTVIWLGGHNARQRPARWPDRPRNTTMTAWADQPSEDITTNQHDRQRYVLPKKVIPLHNDPSWTVAIGHQPTSIECRHIWTHGPFFGEREKKLIIFNILLTGLSYPSSSPHRTFCFLATQNFFMNISFPLKRVLKLL